MILIKKPIILLVLIIVVCLLVFIQIKFIRYGLKTNLWLKGTTKIIIEENLSGNNKILVIEDRQDINKFKSYFENTKIKYISGMSFVRYYKVTVTNGITSKSYGYTRGNFMTNYGKGPGTLTLLLRIYESDTSFESFIKSIIKKDI